MTATPPPTRIDRRAVTAWSLGYTVSVLAGGMVSAVLPLMARDLGVSAAQAIWVLNAFMIANTVTILPAAALADSFGYKRVFRIGCTIFLAASLLAAVSRSFEAVVLARALQGLGAGVTTACLGHFIRVTYPPDRVGRGLALNAMQVSAAYGGGPAVAALVLTVASWPWTFAVCAVIGAVSLLMSRRSLADSAPHPSPIDARSVVLNGAAVSLTILAVQSLAQGGSPTLIALEAAGAVVTGWFFVRRQLRIPKPMLGVDLLRNPVIALSVITMTLAFIAHGMTFATLPFFLHGPADASGARTALLLVCLPAAGMLMAPVAGRLADRYPIGAIGAAGLVLCCLGITLLLMVSPAAATWDLAWRIAVIGVGFALFGPPNTRGIIMSAPQERTGAATGLNATFRSLAQTIGAALAAVLFGWLGGGQATDASSRAALATAAVLVAVGAVLSLSRLHAARRPRG